LAAQRPALDCESSALSLHRHATWR